MVRRGMEIWCLELHPSEVHGTFITIIKCGIGMVSRTSSKRSAKNAGDYLKQVKASRPLGDDPRKASDGRADRCAVLGEHAHRLLRGSSVFAAFVWTRNFQEETMEEYKKVTISFTKDQLEKLDEILKQEQGYSRSSLVWSGRLLPRLPCSKGKRQLFVTHHQSKYQAGARQIWRKFERDVVQVSGWGEQK